MNTRKPLDSTCGIPKTPLHPSQPYHRPVSPRKGFHVHAATRGPRLPNQNHTSGNPRPWQPSSPQPKAKPAAHNNSRRCKQLYAWPPPPGRGRGFIVSNMSTTTGTQDLFSGVWETPAAQRLQKSGPAACSSGALSVRAALCVALLMTAQQTRPETKIAHAANMRALRSGPFPR